MHRAERAAAVLEEVAVHRRGLPGGGGHGDLARRAHEPRVGGEPHVGRARRRVRRRGVLREHHVGQRAVLRAHQRLVLRERQRQRRDRAGLVGVGADRDRHRVVAAGADRGLGLLDERDAVDHRAVGRGRQRAHRLRVGAEDRVDGGGAEARRAIAGARQRGGDRVGGGLGLGAGVEELARAALDERAVEQPRRARRREQRAGVARAGRLAEHQHGVRVSAERRDVVADPAQRGELIERAVVADRAVGAGQRGVGQPAELAEPVVERHHDRVAGLGEAPAVVQRIDRGADGVAAAVDPHQHRARRRGGRRRPQVQVQAVLVADERAVLVELRARRAERGGVELAAGAGRGRGCAQAQVADRRCGVGDVLERPGRASARAADHAAGGDDALVGRARRRCARGGGVGRGVGAGCVDRGVVIAAAARERERREQRECLDPRHPDEHRARFSNQRAVVTVVRHHSARERSVRSEATARSCRGRSRATRDRR